MATFINIDGTIINLDNIYFIEWSDCLKIYFNTDIEHVMKR